MKKILVFLFFFILSATFNLTADNKQQITNLITNKIIIEGEVENPGMSIDFSGLPKHSVISKETTLKNGQIQFDSSFVYKGYSLYDILNSINIERTESGICNNIDLYVMIEGKDGETAIFSWGEIIYSSVRSQSIIATEVTSIDPHFKKADWKLPKYSKLVVATDYITARNISSPAKITIKSIKLPESIKEKKHKKNMCCPELLVFDNDKQVARILDFPDRFSQYVYPCIFFGSGKGFHGVHKFVGPPINFVLEKYFTISNENIKNGLFSVIADEGYRGAFSFSEIFNMNNHQNILLVNCPDIKNEGKFKLFPGNDFYADRAIKSVSQIRFKKNY